jgi:hypothetical protein
MTRAIPRIDSVCTWQWWALDCTVPRRRPSRRGLLPGPPKPGPSPASRSRLPWPERDLRSSTDLSEQPPWCRIRRWLPRAAARLRTVPQSAHGARDPACRAARPNLDYDLLPMTGNDAERTWPSVPDADARSTRNDCSAAQATGSDSQEGPTSSCNGEPCRLVVNPPAAVLATTVEARTEPV